jgi:hypothetical protein
MDTLKLLSAADVIPGYRAPALENYVKVLKPEDKVAPNYQQGEQIITEAQRNTWGDFVVWTASERPAAVTRDNVGEYFLFEIDPRSKGRSRSRRPTANQSRCARFSIWKKHI